MVQKRMEVALDVILACIWNENILYNKQDFYNMQHIHFHKKYKKLTLSWVFKLHKLVLLSKFIKIPCLCTGIVSWKLKFRQIMIEYKIEPFLNYPQSERFLLEKHNLFLIFLMLIFLEFDSSFFSQNYTIVSIVDSYHGLPPHEDNGIVRGTK